MSNEVVKIDLQKVEALIQWESPINLHDVRAFLGFTNFYRWLIKWYVVVVRSIVQLTRKNTPFLWSESCEEAFQLLKYKFTSAPILKHFDPDLEIVVKTDASDYVSAGIFSQYDKETGHLHPVAFFSKNHSPA